MKQLFIAFALVLAIACSGLHAQSVILRANIPFDFWLDKTPMPAGSYQLRYSNGLLLVQESTDGKAAAMVLTLRDYRQEGPAKSVLLFNRYGSTYFLSRISTPELQGGCHLMRSQQEKEFLAHNRIPERTSVVLGTQ